MSVLEVREVSVRGAVRRADLRVGPGQVVLLLGEAGGSTLLRIAAGVLAPATGVVRVGGEDVTGLSATGAAARGAVLAPAGWAAFGGLTVRENVLVGARGDAGRADAALALLPLPADAVAGELDPAAARVLAVAVALARQPRLLLVDGLAAAGPDGCAAVLRALRAAATGGMASVVAERAAFAGREPIAPEGLDPASFDAAYVVRAGIVRRWQPEPAG